MLIWLEKFVLAACVGAFVTLVLVNVVKLDSVQRWSLGLALVAFSLFVARTISNAAAPQSTRDATAPQQPTTGLAPQLANTTPRPSAAGSEAQHGVVTSLAPPVVAVPPTVAPDSARSSTSDERAIDWNFAHTVSLETRAETLFGFASGAAGFWVTYFRITGRNLSGEPILDVKAQVIPQIAAGSVPLQFELRPNERVDTNDYVIEPGASFVLAAPVPSPPHAHGSHGYTASEYLAKIGGFDLVFEARNIRVTHSFTFTEVKEMIKAAEQRHGPKAPPPTVRKR